MSTYPYSTLPAPFYQTVPVPAPAPPPINQIKSSTTVVASAEISKVLSSAPSSDKPPVTTVFVGNIAESVPDNLIKSLLMRCGNILSWKRIQGVNGKLQAFGFCDYERPEATLRCVRLLNGLKVDNKNLLVKVDAKTEDLLDNYKKNNSEIFQVKDDDAVKIALTTILEEHNRLPYTDSISKKSIPAKELDWKQMQGMDLDQDKKELINKEINSFRSKFEAMEEEARKEEETKLRAVGAAAMAYAPGRVNEVEIRDSNRRRDRSRSRSAERRRKAALSLNNSSSMNGNSSSGISAFTTRRGDERRRDRSRERKVDDEEEIIKRRLARKLREKEESYQRLLDHWTSREKKKAYEYEKERDKERKKKEEIEAEAERLLEFFDEYDDEIEDPRYYVGTALQRRLTDRQAEKTADDRDRQKEIEQLEEARCKVIESGDPNAETIILQMEQKMQEHLRKRFNSSDNKEVRTSARILDVAREAIYQSNGSRHPPKRRDHSDDEDEGEVVEPEKDTLKIPVTQTSKANNLPANETFKREQDEEDAEEKALLEATKVKYVPKWIPSGHEDPKNLTNEEESKLIAKAASKLTEEERNALVKQIIQKIPTEKDSLFAYPIEWDFVDLEFIDNRIRPWVDKKMVSYLGEVEMTLSNFICDQLLSKNTPQKILQDISMVLDDEAEGFVVKMWRLLIYVIAAKKAGLE